MKGERKFDESKILLYKESGDESIFEKIIEDAEIKNYLKTTCFYKIKNYPSSLLGIEDLLNLSYLQLWQSIHLYKFICPKCSIKCKTESAYKLHVIGNHKEYIEPLVSISKFIKFRIGAYLQNEIRREYSEERKSNVMTVNIFSAPSNENEYEAFDYSNSRDSLEYQLSESNRFEDSIDCNDLIDIVLNKLDNNTKEIFLLLYKENMKQVDIAERLCLLGRYSNQQSAAVVISRTIKYKISPLIKEIYNKIS